MSVQLFLMWGQGIESAELQNVLLHTDAADRRRPAAKRFGDLLRGHRLRCGFSQAYLAEKAGISVEAVSTLERGTRRAPYSSTIGLLITALQLNQEETLEFEAAAEQARARAQPSDARQKSVANNLPAQFSSFVGRDKDVAEIGELVNNRRLVSVIGAGGIGKTRIALRVGANLLDGTFEGVWLVDLAPLSDAALIPAAILSALNASESPSRKPYDALTAFLKSKHVLLILDNCEHLIEGAAAVVNAILQHCPLVHILATSREILGVGGERVVRVPTLSVPARETLKTLTVEDALEHGAVALFIDRAMDADSRFELTEALVPAIVEICRRLDGIPLALEIAAARVNILSPTALAERLNERFLILSGGKRTAPPRHRTIRALLDWSYELLNEREQRLLRKLSVFVGGFTLELARAQSAQDEPIDEAEMLYLLGSLVDKSLLQFESQYDTTRYRLLESTRQYANENLHECNESVDAARAHAFAILMLVERFSPFHFISDRVWKTEGKPEIENWRAALNWAFGPRGDVRLGQRLAGSINEIWFSQNAAEGLRWVRHAIDTCDDETPPAIRAKLEFAQANMSYPLGRAQTAEAVSAAERALHLYQEAADPLGVAGAQAFLGEAHVLKGRIEEGEPLLRASITAAEAAGARRLVASTTTYLGIARSMLSDLNTARQLIRDALYIYKAGGTGHQWANQGLMLAEFEFQAGDPEAALQLALESIEIFRDYNEALNLCATLSNAAAYSVALERFDEARRYAREALDLAADGGFDLQVAWVSQHLAAICALRGGDLRLAARALGFVDTRFAELERPRDYTEQQEYEKILGVLRRELAVELDELMREGTHWSKERALEHLSQI